MKNKQKLSSWLIFKLLWVKNEELFDSMWWGCWLPNKSCLTHGNNFRVFQIFMNKSKLLLLRIIFPVICVHMCVCLYYIVHGILQARILEWVAVSFSRGSSQTPYVYTGKVFSLFAVIWKIYGQNKWTVIDLILLISKCSVFSKYNEQN